MSFWNKKIINLEDRCFGMELSDFSVKVFQLEERGNVDVIRSFAYKEIKPGIVDNGKIINKEKVVEIITQAIKSAGPKKINTKKVICSVPESKVFLRTISIPKIDKDEAAEAIKWEIEASIPLSVDQVYYDWQFLDQSEGKQNVLTVAVAKETIDELVGVLEMCGLFVYGLEMESIATMRSLIPFSKNSNKSYLIVDIAAEKTSFTIVKNSIPYFTSSIPFSSSLMTDTISTAMNVSLEEAEKIKTAQGIEKNEENPVLNMIQPLLENLSVEIEKTIDFYHTMSEKSSEIERIIITGGGANLRGIIPYFVTRLGREVDLGSPWVNLNLGKNLPPINRSDSVRYATAAGLAMWGIKSKLWKYSYMEIRLNLIPPEKKAEIAKNHNLRLIIRLEVFLAIVVLLFIVVLASFSYILNMNMGNQLNEKKQTEKEVQYEKIKNYDEQFSLANSKISKIMTIKKDQVYWSAFFDKMNGIVFPGIDVFSISNVDYSITILGRSLTRDDLILFKEKLEKDSCFSSVDLPLSNLVDKSNIEFQIDFEISKDCLKR
jgi:type IV pilus assembly protein PilM